MTSDYLNNREQEEAQQSIAGASSSFINPITAGLGAIAIGAAIYGGRLAGGGRIISNLLHFLGHPRGIGVKIDDAVNLLSKTAHAGTAGLNSVTTSTINIKTGKLHIGPVDLIDDLRSSLELINAAPRQLARRITNRYADIINRKYANHAIGSYFGHDLQRVTLGEVLNDSNIDNWRAVLGEEQVSILERARTAGLIKNHHIIDKGLYLSPNRTIRDLRLSSLFTRPVEVRGPSGPHMARVPIFDLFGQQKVVSSLLGVNRNFAVLAGDTKHPYTRIFMDGEVYGYSYDKSGGLTEILLGTNRRIVPTDSPLLPVQDAIDGTIKYRLNKRSGIIGKWITKFEQFTGVGKSFSSRPSLIERLIIDPIKRYVSLFNDSGVVFRHPHRYGNPFNKVMDAIAGADMPEVIGRHGAIQPVPNGGTSVNLDELSWYERISVIFDLSDKYSVVKANAYSKYATSNGASGLGNSDLIVPRKDKGIVARNNKIHNRDVAENLTDVNQESMNSVGIVTPQQTARFTDVPESSITTSIAGKYLPKITSLKTLLNYSIYRISSLASEAILGISFAPAKSFIGNLARMASIPLIYEAGKETLGYADYLTEEYLGFSPIKTAADIYANLRVGQQEVRSAIGIQQGSKWLDENYPGIINSEGSTILRSIIAPLTALSYFMGKDRLGIGAIAAGTLYSLIGGPDPGQSAEELKDEYLGETKVPVRKGRLWGLGYLPLFGGEVDYYEHSWYHKLQSDYKTKSMYGTRKEYYNYHANVMGVPLPTPHNLFGIKNILNPYRFEELHYSDRPYETTGASLEDFPIIGPLLSRTLGKILKPTINRQMDMPLLQAGLVQRGLDPATARNLGMSKLDVSDAQITDPSDFRYSMNKLANVASEPMGVYKFVLEFFGVKFGKEAMPVKASSEIATSSGRAFYDMQIGGMFGNTEFMRRFFVSDYYNPHKNAGLINNIRNSMPDWMPGKASSSIKDQSYFIDYTTGDPFIKIYGGEGRLPGAGYEALNKLHSGQPGVYSDVDRFLILSDVAPYSQAYRSYESKVLKMDLDPYWSRKVQNALKYKNEAVGVDTRYLRYEDTLSDLNKATIDGALYKTTRQIYDVITHDFLAELPYVGSKLFPFRNPYEQYRKLNVEGSEFASWDRPYEGVLRPMAMDIASSNPIMGAVKGAGIGLLISGPMKWFNPLTTLVESEKNAMLKGAIIGSSISLTRQAFGLPEDFMPAHRQEESDAAVYMDAINYLKYRSLSEVAKEQGKPSGQLASMVQRTMLGARSPLMLRSTLPTSTDRRYFEYFMNTPENIHNQIYEGVPGFMKSALRKAWTKDYNTIEEADAQAAAILGDIPSDDWIGWRPEIPINATKIHLVKHGINGVSDNYHRFGFYESQENDILSRIPEFNDLSVSYNTLPINSRFTDILSLKNKGYMSQFGGARADVLTASTFNRSHKKLTVYMDRKEDTISTVNRYVYE